MLRQEKVVCSDVLRKGKQLCMVLHRSTVGRGGGRRRSSSVSLGERGGSYSAEEANQRNYPTTNSLQGNTANNNKEDYYYLFLHMGMTGSIQSPGVFTAWGHKEGSEKNKTTTNKTKDKDDGGNAEGGDCYPPKYAYLTFQTGDYCAGK